MNANKYKAKQVTGNATPTTTRITPGQLDPRRPIGIENRLLDLWGEDDTSNTCANAPFLHYYPGCRPRPRQRTKHTTKKQTLLLDKGVLSNNLAGLSPRSSYVFV